MADDHRYRSRRQDTEFFTHFSRSSSNSYRQPSFSSSLLDSIYRSLEEEMVFYEEPIMRKKMENFKTEKELMADLRRASMIEKWMEKKLTEKPVADVKKLRKDRRSSSSSSSDSSCTGGGGLFSSSESDSFPVPRPKPIRTAALGFDRKEKFDENRHKIGGLGALEHGGGFLKTKSRVQKIYGDLKKEKWQPISPGGKVVAFLNSIFAGGGSLRKSKFSGDDSASLKSTTCSSASSFSRSCLSKTPSSSKCSSGSGKRSVRFFPVSVIVDEDCQPCGHKSLYHENENAIDEELIRHIMEKNRRAQEAEGDFMMDCKKKITHEFEILRKAHIENQESDRGFEEEDDDDFDAASYASSDLFELDNLSAIGMESYTEELPVYETTDLDTNRAIANGRIL